MEGEARVSSSAVTGFFKLPAEKRVSIVGDHCTLGSDILDALNKNIVQNAENMDMAAHVLPIGVATNFTVDHKDIFIPMGTEEPSIIAGASFAAKLCRSAGGFVTSTPQTVYEIRLTFSGFDHITTFPQSNKVQLGEDLNKALSSIEYIKSWTAKRVLKDKVAFDFLLTEQKSEEIVESIVNSLGVQIYHISQFCPAQLYKAVCRFDLAGLKTKDYEGDEVGRRVVTASHFAAANDFRCATHRKGVMNGIVAVAETLGIDTRAVQLAPFYTSLTKYWIEGDQLVGESEIPLQVIGTPSTLASQILGTASPETIGRILSAVGLAQNFAALRALVTTGIPAGHMKLHSRNIACEAGATISEIDIVSKKIQEIGSITVSAATKIIRQIRCSIV